jgi:hypothetical protein
MLRTEKTKRHGKRAGRTAAEGGTTMATTSGNLTTGKAITGRDGHGSGIQKRAAGLLATATLGLGLLAGTLLGQGHQLTGGQRAQGAVPSPVHVALGDRDDPRFAGAQYPYIAGQFSGMEQQRFLEQNLTLPSGTLPGVSPGYQFTYHDDDTRLSAPAFIADQFTYREDHRVVASAEIVGPAQVASVGKGCAQTPGAFACSAGAPAYANPGAASVSVLDTLDFGPVECGMAPCMSAPAASANSRALYDGINPGFLETNAGEARSLPVVADQFTYREDHRAGCPVDASVTAEYRWDFGAGLVAQRPVDASVATDYRWDFGAGLPVARPVDASTSAEYRWDFPAVTTAVVADPFTYWEDHRASAPASVASFLPGVTGLLIYA